MAGRNCQGGVALPHVDGPASWQAKNSTGSFHFSIPLPNGEWYDFFQATPRGGIFPHYIVEHDNKASWEYQGSWERTRSFCLPSFLPLLYPRPLLHTTKKLTMRCPAKGGTFLSSIASSPANELKDRLQLLLQETTVEDKSPSEKAKYSIVDV